MFGFFKKFKSRVAIKGLQLIMNRKIFNTSMRNGYMLRDFSVWTPGSVNWWRYPRLIIDNANTYPQSLFRLCKMIDSSAYIRIDHIDNFGNLDLELTKKLSELFSSYGSDKSTNHDYYKFYSDSLHQLGKDARLNVLEIGIGTNNPTLVSTMGPGGNPGASLRAFRDLLSNAQIYGADIDNDILFSEDRINTAYLDQLEIMEFDRMTSILGEDRFDLIIDDGLHSVQANLNSLMFAIKHLNINGICVIEYIPERSLPAWMPVLHLLKGQICGIVECKSAYLFWLRKSDLFDSANEY